MNKLNTTLLIAVVLALSACSSNLNDQLTEEAKIYTKTKAIYCGGASVKNFAEFDDLIAITCADDSVKTIFLD